MSSFSASSARFFTELSYMNKELLEESKKAREQALELAETLKRELAPVRSGVDKVGGSTVEFTLKGKSYYAYFRPAGIDGYQFQIMVNIIYDSYDLQDGAVITNLKWRNHPEMSFPDLIIEQLTIETEDEMKFIKFYGVKQ